MCPRRRCAVAWTFILLACASGGCYDAREVNNFLLKHRTPVSGAEYRVLPPDVLLVTSQRVAEINNLQTQIRPDGRINLPLLGELCVAGSTPAEIETAIREAAQQYYDEVDANVQVLGYNSQRFFVFGQVARPGPYPWTGHDTLLDALAQAQPTFLAWPERISVVRAPPPQEGGVKAEINPEDYAQSGIRPEDPDRPRHQLRINMMAMVETGDLSNNIMLLPNDVIYVRPNPLAAVGLAIQSLLFPIRPAAETIVTPNVIRDDLR